MFSIQQLIKSTRKLQASSVGSADLAKNLKHAAVVGNHYSHNHHHYQHHQQQTNHYEQTHLEIGIGAVAMTPAVSAPDMTSKILLSTPSPSSSSSLSLSPLKTPTSSSSSLPSSLSASPSPRQRQTNVTSQPQQQQQSHEEQLNSNEAIAIERSSNRKTTTMTSDNSSSGKYGSCDELSQCSDLKENSSSKQTPIKIVINTQEHKFTTTTNTIASNSAVTTNNSDNNNAFAAAKISRITSPHFCNRSQKSFYQQQLQQLHTQANQSLWAKQKQTHFTMSSLAAAEPLSALKNTDDLATAATAAASAAAAAAATTSNSTNGDNGVAENSSKSMTANKGKTCFKSGCSEILQFMELIGNLKHTKRTGWVLRDVNDCESISGHMYRMSMMTFLLDGTEGLNPIRCMELALVHDLAESIVGDLTPFCGISKEEKRNKEFKAMDDICKLIEPRGKRIMELFVEYETGESAESKFVKDLDRLDMVMQAFEYEKRDNCLLKHQEFFDSTEGKFKHPFVQQLVKEIYAQRVALAKDKGATPPPNIVVPDWEHPTAAAPTQTPNGNQSNGHCCKQKSSAAGTAELPPEQNSSKTSTS